GKKYKSPTNADGSWKWDYTGPDKDDEFGYGLNGHKYLGSLFTVWKKTGDTKYINRYDQLVKDWVIHHPMPDKGDSVYMVWDPKISLDYRDIGEVEWRTLETGHRLGASWPQTFYALQNENSFSPAARLLLLSSLAIQSDFLQQNHKSGHNWTTMELNGLALAGLAFPEFENADTWANYSQDVMKEEINRQVYPDGLQTEISSKTQWVALNRFETLASNFAKAEKPMSEEYLSRVELMYDYLAFSIRPDGHQPLNNDSDRDDLKPRLLKAANKFNRPDWKWIVTNGKSGALPEIESSITFPWAGIHVMRNGWNRDADWSFFDAGPYGTGHQHRDKLHLSINAFGKDLLVDGGRYTHKDYFNFDPAFWRGYFRSSYSHNVILVDGNGQKEGHVRTDVPLVDNEDYIHTSSYDYAYGSFDDGFEKVDGEAVHSRSVLYIKGKYWVVLDHFKTDRPRKIQALWHYAPDNEVTTDGIEALSTNANEPNLRVVPVGNIPWEVEIIVGQETPVIQGWYSSVFGEKVTNPTMVYSTEIKEPTTFAWVMVPARGAVPKVKVDLQIKNGIIFISIPNADTGDVSVSMPIEKDISKVKVTF
ncbi:MAG: heparinase II/III family protein, partial [Cyclobacteriaceae bacterium]|nr:heparinase II/III family protein [Cyclobacteriaceae bacterium]